MSHAFHYNLPGYHARQILHDGCQECEERGESVERALANLDLASFSQAWRRAYDVYGSGRNVNRVDRGTVSHAEQDLLRALYGVQVHLERFGHKMGQVPT